MHCVEMLSFIHFTVDTYWNGGVELICLVTFAFSHRWNKEAYVNSSHLMISNIPKVQTILASIYLKDDIKRYKKERGFITLD